MKLFILFGKGYSKMFISLLSLFVGHEGPAKMGLNLMSLGFEISIHFKNIYLYLYVYITLKAF